jgi:quercetin dioxygenase-like cupin family protein/peroxiredoxin
MMTKWIKTTKRTHARWVVAPLLFVASLLLDDPHAASGEERAGKTGAALVGQLAPAATLDTVDGKRIELGDLYGRKPVYLKFWATWCVPCRQQMPHFEQVWQRYRESVAIVAVNLGLNDDSADVQDFLDKTKLSMPVAIDSTGDLATAFGVIVTPLHVLIDADGRVAYVGHEAGADLDRALDALSRSKPQSKVAAGSRTRIVGHAGAVVGAKAPAFAALSEGRKWSFTPGKTGKPAVLAFIMPWCESYLKDSRPEVAESCRQSREALTLAYRTSSDRASWFAVASRVWVTEADVLAYRKKMQMAYPVALDASGEIFRRFGIKEVPTVLIVDADGTIRSRFDGYSPDLASALASLNASPVAGPQAASAAKKSGVLFTEALPSLEGKEVTMLTVDVPPGGESAPHRHNGHVYVYMLEGSMVMKTREGPATTLVPGQHFVERPQDVHMVSRNASATEPARFLVVMIKEAGAPITVPASPR